MRAGFVGRRKLLDAASLACLPVELLVGPIEVELVEPLDVFASRVLPVLFQSMNQTGHRSQAMVRRYIREGNLFNDNAAARLGL